MDEVDKIVIKDREALARLSDLHKQASDYIRQAKASNTWRAYKADWTDFENWCRDHLLVSLPASPSTVALYLTERANSLKPSSLQRRIAAIAQIHTGQKFSDPTKHAEVKECWRGIRRAKRVAPKVKSPARIEILRELVAILPDTMKGIRDRALLLLGFAGALRRSELVSLDFADLEFSNDGLAINLRRSKTDQEGTGRKVGIPYGSNPATCPVRSLQKWLTIAGIKDGALFRGLNRHGQIISGRLTDKVVALVVKECAKNAGLNPDLFAGHSLRAGLATSAAAAGVSERAIMNQTGHKNVQMVRRYIREEGLFKDNAAGKVGL